jgi:hypothetical protein
LRTQLCARRRDAASSTPRASQIVHVTSEANASPIITAFTTSACTNIPHGDRSRDNGRLQRQLASGHYSAG